MQKELISLIFCKLLNNDNKQIDIIKQTLEKVSNSVQVFFTPLDNSFVFISSIPVTRKKGILNSIENNISFVVNSLDVEIQIQSVYACGETKEENAVYDFFGGADYNFLFISTIKNNSSIEKKDLSNYLEKGKREKKYDYAFGVAERKYIDANINYLIKDMEIQNYVRDQLSINPKALILTKEEK